MTADQYDKLQAEIRQAWRTVHARQAALKEAEGLLESLLRELSREDARLVAESLEPIHNASRKLVVGE